MLGDRFADVGECGAQPYIAAGMTGRDAQDRDAFAGMVGAAPRWVAAMIGGQKQEVTRLQTCKSFGQTSIEGFKRCRIAGNVAAVAEQRIEIDEIGEDEIAVASFLHRAERRVKQSGVSACLANFGHAAMGEDVADLADAENLAAARNQPIEKCRFGRRDGKVAPVRRSLETGRAFADKRTRDHPPDIQGIDQFANDTAKLIQPIETEMQFMRGDLDDGIGRCVANWLGRSDMFLAIGAR